MQKDLIYHLSSLLGIELIEAKPVSGGDISSAYCFRSKEITYFIKYNSGHSALAMFQAEQKGLREIASCEKISVPEVILTGEHNGYSFLVMEMVESKRASSKDFRKLASQLAQMHLVSNQNFGFDDDNYIAYLPQKNDKHENWTDFYIHCRLIPQFDMLKDRSLLSPEEIPSIPIMENFLQPLFEGIIPSLLHGDLWNGNYLIEKSGTPYLIDPAVYYGHSEVDIAMTQLFGGFGPAFYETYHKIIPPNEKSDIRIDIYKLYYLLVHLNLFGRSYYSQVMHILNKYFR